MTITPLLWFRGDCEEAFRLYARAFTGTIVTMLTYAHRRRALPFRRTGARRFSTRRSGLATRC